MTSDELRAAAGYLKTIRLAEGESVVNAIRLVVEHVLATQRADDGELIDCDWLRANGFSAHHCNDTQLIDGSDCIICDTWGMEFTVCNARPIFTTRGQVRKLVEALGGR